MMRKRARSSPDPKIKKRCKIPPQTDVVEKPTENEEKVRLDFLIVVKIASLTKLKFAPDVCQELVSVTFANALHSFYSKTKLTLSIVASSDFLRDDQSIIRLSVNRLSQRWKEEIKFNRAILIEAIKHIFARFPRINLKLKGGYIDDITFVLRYVLNRAPDVTIESLKISADYYIVIRCQELIEKLSANLRVLNLYIGFSFDGNEELSLSEPFWRAVSSCPKLVSLSAVFIGSDDIVDEGLIMDVSDCIKLLKISHFRINLNGSEDWEDYIMEWLPGALINNENLRQLEFDAYDACDALDDFIDDQDEILCQLDSLKINIYDDAERRPDLPSSLENILSALSGDAVLKVSVDMRNEEDFEESIFNMLEMCLRLSHEEARKIKLRLLNGEGDAVEAAKMFDLALTHILTANEFRGVKTLPFGRWIRILFGNANLMVKLRTIPNDWLIF